MDNKNARVQDDRRELSRVKINRIVTESDHRMMIE